MDCNHHNFMCMSCGFSVQSVLLSAQSHPSRAQMAASCSFQEHFETGSTLPAKFILLCDIAQRGSSTQIVCLCQLFLTRINQYCLFWFAFASFNFKQVKSRHCLVTIWIFVVYLKQQKKKCLPENLYFHKWRKNHLQRMHKRFSSHSFTGSKSAQNCRGSYCVFSTLVEANR